MNVASARQSKWSSSSIQWILDPSRGSGQLYLLLMIFFPSYLHSYVLEWTKNLKMPSGSFETKTQNQVVVFVLVRFKMCSSLTLWRNKPNRPVCGPTQMHLFVLMSFRMYSTVYSQLTIAAHCVEIVKEESICDKKQIRRMLIVKNGLVWTKKPHSLLFC